MSEHRHKRVVGGRCQGHGLTEVGIHHLSEYHRKDQRGNRIIEPAHHESHQSEEEHESHIKQTVVAREGTDHTEARYHRDHDILRDRNDLTDPRGNNQS